MVGLAFSISVEYNKRITDAFGVSGSATTWDSGITGTHGSDAAYIVSLLSQILDKFLAAFLRVNEPACSTAPAKR